MRSASHGAGSVHLFNLSRIRYNHRLPAVGQERYFNGRSANKKTPSKRGMHRSHDHLENPPVAVEPTTGEVHLRHHISPNGYYRGKKIVKTKSDE